MTVPETRTLIDRALLERHRRRAVRMAVDGADFLLREAVHDLSLRLSTLTRDFPVAVDLNSPDGSVAEALRSSGRIGAVYSARSQAYAGVAQTHAVFDDEIPALKTASIDLIVSTLNLQLVNDLPGTLVQVRRALKPDGAFLASFIGGDSLIELRQAFLAAEAELTGNASARIIPFIDVREAGGLLQRAGFALPVADVDTIKVRYGDLLSLFRDLRGMGATNPLKTRSKLPLRRDLLQRTMEIYREKYADGDDRLPVTFDIISLLGWAPHPDQQKPLQPGSAKVSLADVLSRSEDEAS